MQRQIRALQALRVRATGTALVQLLGLYFLSFFSSAMPTFYLPPMFPFCVVFRALCLMLAMFKCPSLQSSILFILLGINPM